MTDARTAPACPICHAPAPQALVSAAPVPAHSVVLHRDRAAAVAAPSGHIALGACRDCGFVYNTAFHSGAMAYGADYEATQAHSATFNAFHGDLATQIADTIRDRPGVVVEIGCGQGEFLTLLEANGCRGAIGFDPAFDPARSALPGDGTAIIHQTVFPENPDLPQVSAVLCKMTLEHIADPIALLRAMATLSRANAACPVFVQVPNGADVFARDAFWDVYHEHCNYFTEATLTDAMTRAGLQVTRTDTAYDGQYLLMTAQATPNDAPRAVGTHDPQAEIDRFAAFAARLETAMTGWRARLNEWTQAGERVVIWGGGSKAIGFLSFTGAQDAISAIADINPRKHGTFLPGSGIKVMDPAQWQGPAPDRIVLMNRAYLAEVAEMVALLGWTAPITCLDPETGNPIRVCIGVVTRQRPRMVAALLASLRDLDIPGGVAPMLAVVENDTRLSLDPSQAEMADWEPGILALEPRIGIPHARNHVLDIALEHCCDFTAFIDDDEVADPAWLAELMAEIEGSALDLVGGPVALLPPPGDSTAWHRMVWRGLKQRFARVRHAAKRNRDAGRADRITVVTSNWIVRNAFLRRTGLRFDPAYLVSGGSDTAFFHAAQALGARTGWTDRAHVFEHMPIDRLTLGYQFRRAMGQSMVSYRRKYGDTQSAATIAKSIAFVLFKLIAALVMGLAAPLTGGRSLIDCVRSAGFAFGRWRAMFGGRSTLYSRIQGD
jgi:hypothetical protein